MASQGIVWLPVPEETELFWPLTIDVVFAPFCIPATFAIQRPLNSPDMLTGTALGSKVTEVVTVPVYVKDMADQSTAQPACRFAFCNAVSALVDALVAPGSAVWVVVPCCAMTGIARTRETAAAYVRAKRI